MGAATLLVLAGLPACAGDVPFAETFDGHTTGLLHNQNSWHVQNENNAQVQPTTVYAGGKAVVVSTNTLVWQNFTNSNATNVWIDYYAQVPHPTNDTPPAIQGEYAAAFYTASDGRIHAVSNNTWVTLSHTLATDTWYRFTLHLNYESSRWALYVSDSTPHSMATAVATNLAFSATSTNTYFHRFRVKN